MSNDEKIIAYKGFDKNWKCRDFQYEVGKTYEHQGEVKACAGGFHACEYPLDVFGYYAPGEGNKFAAVEQSGDLSRHEDDSKVASRHISIKAEFNFAELVKASIEYVTTRCEPRKAQHTNGDSSASSATGNSSASSATGDRSASSATGYRSASSATGDSSASSATGNSSASSATGNRSASSATGDSSASLTTGSCSNSKITAEEHGKPLHAVAIATGYQSKAQAPQGSAIVLVHRNDDGEIVHIRASKVGHNGIKPETWYMLDAEGDFVEVAE